MTSVVPDPGDELVDIVDANDVVTYQTTRRDMRSQCLRHRAVYIAVLNDSGQLLVHQRSFAKDVAPGHWDIAVGGVVSAGETYDAAAQRELAEEIGISDVPLQSFGGGNYEDHLFKIIGRCYKVHHEGPFSFNDGEVIQTKWVSRGELETLLRTEAVCGDSIALILPLLEAQITQ